MRTFYKITLFFALLISANNVFAQTNLEKGVELYKQGSYKSAEQALKKLSKSDSSNAQVWYYLGLSYLRLGERKESTKALEKAVELDAASADINAALAFVYFLRNKQTEAMLKAQKALEINPNIAEAHYIIGVHNYRNGAYENATERAEKAVEINPKFVGAYLLKSEALVSTFAVMSRPGIVAEKEKARLLKEAIEALEKYLIFPHDDEEAEFQREYLESLRFFAEYYARVPMPQGFDADATESKAMDSRTPLKILTRPQPFYTHAAREAEVSGTVRLLVGFGADGTVKHVLAIQRLGFGLDKEAIKAVRKVKFEPATEYGKPVSSVKTVVYTFTIY